MAQYIDKDALLAEIDRQKIGYNVDGKHSIEYDTTRKILNIIDTLEVKEVDLDKYINKYFKGWYVDLTDQGNILHSPDGQAGLMSMKKVAKHFFELGLKTQKGE